MEISKHQTALAENPARNNAGTAAGTIVGTSAGTSAGTSVGTIVGTSVGTTVGATVNSVKSAVPVQERPDMAPVGAGVNILRSTAGAAENANTNSCLSPPRPRARAVRIFKQAGRQTFRSAWRRQREPCIARQAGRLSEELGEDGDNLALSDRSNHCLPVDQPRGNLYSSMEIRRNDLWALCIQLYAL